MERRAIVLSSLAVVALAGALVGCDPISQRFAGDTVVETRTTDTFDAIEIRGAVDTTIVAGEAYSITIRAGDKVVGDVHTSVIGTTLVIDEEHVGSAGRVEVVVHAPTITSVQILGAGTVDISGIDTPQFAIALAGTGEVKAEGRAGTFVAVVGGTGSIDSLPLLADHVTARLAGVGSIKVAASVTLDAELTGVGEIRYSGDPVVTSHVTGVGEINRV